MSYVCVIYVLCACDICLMCVWYMSYVCVIYVLCVWYMSYVCVIYMTYVCDICLMCVLFVYIRISLGLHLDFASRLCFSFWVNIILIMYILLIIYVMYSINDLGKKIKKILMWTELPYTKSFNREYTLHFLVLAVFTKANSLIPLLKYSLTLSGRHGKFPRVIPTDLIVDRIKLLYHRYGNKKRNINFNLL